MTTQLPQQIAALLDAAADKYGIARGLARGVAWIESKGNPFAKSDKGAIGVMQLLPDTAKGLGVTNIYDPAQNIDGGVRYLASLVKRLGESDAVLAYNWGPQRVANFLAGKLKTDGKLVTEVPQQLKTYVSKVFTRAAFEGHRTAVGPLAEQSGRHLGPHSSRSRSSDNGDDNGGSDGSG